MKLEVAQRNLRMRLAKTSHVLTAKIRKSWEARAAKLKFDLVSQEESPVLTTTTPLYHPQTHSPCSGGKATAQWRCPLMKAHPLTNPRCSAIPRSLRAASNLARPQFQPIRKNFAPAIASRFASTSTTKDGLIHQVIGAVVDGTLVASLTMPLAMVFLAAELLLGRIIGHEATSSRQHNDNIIHHHRRWSMAFVRVLMGINSKIRHGAVACYFQCLADGEQRPEAHSGSRSTPSTTCQWVMQQLR